MSKKKRVFIQVRPTAELESDLEYLLKRDPSTNMSEIIREAVSKMRREAMVNELLADMNAKSNKL